MKTAEDVAPDGQLFAIDQNSPEYNETARRGVFYAESWALTHYLLAGSPQRRGQLLELLRLAKTGTPGKEAFRKVFGGDPAALEREAHTYVQSYTFPYTRSPLQPEQRAMFWIKLRKNPFPGRQIRSPSIKPCGMHSVARAIDVAAKQALVRLHQFRRLFCDGTAHGAGEAPVAPQTADIERVAQHRLDKLEASVGPLPRIERNSDAALEQRFQCALDKTLGAAVRRIALPNDRKTHGQTGNAAPLLASVALINSVRAA